MSRVSAAVYLALVAIVLLAALFVAASSPRSSEAKNDVDVNNRTKVITITVNVTMIGNPNKVAFLEQAFNSYWGKPGYTFRCYKVVMKLVVKPGSSRQAGTHTVFMTPTNPGDPWVSSVSSPNNYNPTTESATGNWSDWDDANVVAHEFGHVLGLPDEYSYTDKPPKNGRRDHDEPSIPDPSKAPEYSWTDKPPTNGKIDPGEVTLNPGQKRPLMAEYADGTSEVLQRHIDSIVNKHASRGSIDCPWKGSGKFSSVPLNDDYRQLTRDANFDFEFDVDEDGNVSGEITLTYSAVLTVDNLPEVSVGFASFDPNVGGEITDPNPVRTFPLVGTLIDNMLTLELGTPDDEREPIEFTIRADPGVSAGLDAGGTIIGAPGDEQVIVIDMTPFSPFAGELVPVEEGPNGQEAHYFESGDDYEVEWDAELIGGEGAPVG